MSRFERIKTLIEDQLAPVHLEIEDESHQHAGNRTETHFRLVIVSPLFEHDGLLARHRRVQALLHAEQEGGMHALSLHTFTPSEWLARGSSAAPSPACAGQNH
ncbi:BolA family protein [Halothiobacillus sp.]|uniref:BolA family protein n=1 Tax=Halothiobacillus sp. TaxID=1891311 RepID=UPI0026219120|nr:BolA family protein [Halothiobacillus sp.]